MKALALDPVIWAAGGVFLLAFLLWIWALRALLKPSAPKAAATTDDLPFMSAAPEKTPYVPDAPALTLDPLPPPPPPPVAPAAPVVPELNRQVAEKVDLIALRLVDMQMLLNKQLSTPAATAGTAFSPETVDKLLKIMASVVQQVEVLQKSLPGPGAGSAAPVNAPRMVSEPPAPLAHEPVAPPPAAVTPDTVSAAPVRPAPQVTPVSKIVGHPPKTDA